VTEQVSSDVGPPLLGRAVRHHFFLILLTTLLFPVVMGVLALTRTPTYTSSATVLLKPLAGAPLSPEIVGTLQQTTGMMTEAALVNSTPVVARANEILRGEDLDAGTPAVKATVPASTTIIRVDFTATTATRAKRGANAFAQALLSYRQEQSAAEQKNEQEALDSRIRSVEAQLPTASPRDRQGLVNELAELRAAVSRINADDAGPGESLTPAYLPTSQSNLNPWLLIGAAAVLGLAAGLALALWRERNDNRLRGASADSAAGVPILASLRFDQYDGATTVARSAPDSPFAEAFQEARARILALAPPPRAVTVAAADATSGADFVGVNLAQTLAYAGYRVALVSTGEDSTVELLLDIEPTPGLSDVLVGRPLDQVAVMVQGVVVVPNGNPTEHRSDLLASRAFSQAIRDLQREADYVIVVGSQLSAPNALAAALPTDGVLLTGQEGETTRTDVEDAVRRARGLDVPVIGLVLVERQARRSPRRPRSQGAADRPPSRMPVDQQGDSARDQSMLTHPR
jgi:Mrp family chromosome partitioning ATPase